MRTSFSGENEVEQVGRADSGLHSQKPRTAFVWIFLQQPRNQHAPRRTKFGDGTFLACVGGLYWELRCIPVPCFSEEENDVVIISMRKSVPRGPFRANVALGQYFSTQRNKIQYHLFCAKEVGSLLWEVRELAMLSTAPGIGSVFFIASRLQHKCSWCSKMAVVQYNAVVIRAHPEQYLVLVVAARAGI